MDQDLANKKRTSKFSFSRPNLQQQAPSQQRNLQNFKNRFKNQINLVIDRPNEDTEKLSVHDHAFKMAEKLGVSITEQDLECIKFSLDDYRQNYEEEQVLGEGCIGLVKSVRHKSTQQLYAVKIVKTTDEEIMILEFKNLQKLNQKNIVKMHELYAEWKDGFQATGLVYVLMEKINGKEMFEVIQDLGHYSETDARVIFKQILEAIKYMHDHYVCHRDLKPNNILCNEDGSEVKITDFNVSKFSESYKEFSNIEKEGKIEMWTYTGTVAFSAPEQFSGGLYNEAVDLWSAGVILFTMLSGQLPFNSEWLNDLIEKIRKGEYDYTNNVWENISFEAKDLINQLLQVNPEFRIKPEQALEHTWILDEGVRKQTLRRDHLRNNIKKLTVKHHSENTHVMQYKKMRKLCYLFGAGEVWKRNSMGAGNKDQFLEDFRKTKSFDVQMLKEEEEIKVTKEEGKENIYNIDFPDFGDSDDDDQN